MSESIKGKSQPVSPNFHKRRPSKQEIPPPTLPTTDINIITKFAFATRVGFIPGMHKTNQDSFILSPHLNQSDTLHYFGVCDGHGQFGREASTFIK